MGMELAPSNEGHLLALEEAPKRDEAPEHEEEASYIFSHINIYNRACMTACSK
jgi:hypothetical protein